MLLRKIAKQYSAETGEHYVSVFDVARAVDVSIVDLLKLNMTRPFILLFREPIVLMFSIYAAIICT